MFTARHIVSAAFSETGIAGALQHHVLFICADMAADHLTSQLKELCKFLSAGNEESAKRLIETLNPLSVVDAEKVDFTKLPKDILGTSIIPDIDVVNETGHRIALQVTGNGNCSYNSASLILCGDESRCNYLRLYENHGLKTFYALLHLK